MSCYLRFLDISTYLRANKFQVKLQSTPINQLLFKLINLEDANSFLLLTVATNYLSTVKRFQRSAEVNGLPLKILGLGVKYEGFGTKVNLLKEELKRHVDDPEKIILFADSHDVLINSGADEIIKTFKKFKARIVFSAEGNCWPDASLASR